MTLGNGSLDEMCLKIVYCGPAASGKSANLRHIHANTPDLARGDLSVLRFDDAEAHAEFLPLDIGTLGGRRIRFHVYSLPSGPGYEADRVSILSEAAGIVFVADSQRDRFRDDLLSYREMEAITKGLGVDLAQTPLVLQYNKRDLPDAIPVSILDSRLNTLGSVQVEAIAASGNGVLTTLRAVSKLVVKKLQRGQNESNHQRIR